MIDTSVWQVNLENIDSCDLGARYASPRFKINREKDLFVIGA